MNERMRERKKEWKKEKKERKKDSFVALKIINVNRHDRDHATVTERLRRRLQLVKININDDEKDVKISVKRKRWVFLTDRRRRRNSVERNRVNKCHDYLKKKACWVKMQLRKRRFWFAEIEEKLKTESDEKKRKNFINWERVFRSLTWVKKMWMIRRSHETCSRDEWTRDRVIVFNRWKTWKCD